MKRRIGVLAGLLLLGACNTVNGVGKDISAVGRGVSSSAVYVQRAVFGEPVPPAPTLARRPAVSVGQPCDPGAGELAGGSGLPPCRRPGGPPVTVYRGG